MIWFGDNVTRSHLTNSKVQAVSAQQARIITPELKQPHPHAKKSKHGIAYIDTMSINSPQCLPCTTWHSVSGFRAVHTLERLFPHSRPGLSSVAPRCSVPLVNKTRIFVPSYFIKNFHEHKKFKSTSCYLTSYVSCKCKCKCNWYYLMARPSR